MADPLETSGTVLAFGETLKDKRGSISRANRRAICVELGDFTGRITRINGDAHSVEMELITEQGVIVVGIESGIAQESLERERWMGEEEIVKDGL